MVGDAGPADAALSHERRRDGVIHHQRFMTVEADRVPDAATVTDPGLRRADPADIDALARLAVRLHVDDEFGPDPGRAGLRGYRDRISRSVEQGLVWAVGPVGAPVCKLERSVSSRRWGVQLAGIVVDEQRRGAGIGRGAVATAVRQALSEDPPGRPVSLHVRAANATAIGVYKACGFVDREEWRLAVRA
jgi:ribosomal protein S18 acetylase RimI-like enzyme